MFKKQVAISGADDDSRYAQELRVAALLNL